MAMAAESEPEPDPIQRADLVPMRDMPIWDGLGRREMRERLLNVGESLVYFNSLSDMVPAERDATIIGVSESMVDAFYPIETHVSGREGADEEMLVTEQGTYNLGGGANVIRGASLYARRIKMITRTGQLPPLTDEINELLQGLPSNVEVARIIDPNSQNAIKIRFLDDDDIVMAAVNFKPTELGSKETDALVDEASKSIDQFLQEEGKCTLIVSDYGRGQLTESVASALSLALKNSNVPRVFLDPRPDPNSLHKFNIYGAILTPNRQEAQLLAGDQVIHDGKLDSAHAAAEDILGNYPDVKGVIVTLDCDGALSVDRDGTVAHTPAVIKDTEVINPSGAGDIVIAVNALLPRDRFGAQVVLDTAVWLAGVSAKEKNTSTLSPQLVSDTQAEIYELLGKL